MVKTKMDLLVSFDTTGSMYPVLAQVRQQVTSFVKNMFTEFTDLRLGIIAHGDYCDMNDPYTIRVMDFTREEDKLCDFVNKTQKTFGGDADECYELVLNTAHKVLNWRNDAEHLMILIGDASPHGITYPDNKDKLDWKVEADVLRQNNIKIFAVHALAYYRNSSRNFYKTISEITNGVYLTLDQFSEIIDLIKATCYQQTGEEQLTEFISIIKDEGRLTNSLDKNFKRLQGIEVTEVVDTGYHSRERRYSTDTKEVKLLDMEKLVPVLPGRFQTMTVPENCVIKEFVTSNGIEFKKGRGFYELTKHEKVQQYKEVIMQDKETGEMFTGSQVRERLGLQPQSEKGGVTESLSSKDLKEFKVYIQSTSYNRKLIGGTTFLYEINDIEDCGTVIGKSSFSYKDLLPKEHKKVKIEEEKTKKVDKATEEVTEKKTSKIEKKTKVVKDTTDKNIDRLSKDLEKVTTGLERISKSKNKKNTEFLKNNLKKIIEDANKVLENLE